MADLLLEIGTEELPPGDVGPAMEQLAGAVGRTLDTLRLLRGRTTTYGTPRRLAVLVREVADRQGPAERRVRGPAAAAAFDQEGRPTQAAVGFARSQGVRVDSLEVIEESGGRRYAAAVLKDPGKAARTVLPEALAAVIAGLTFAKTMRWGGGEARFARPIRWLVALLGASVLPLEAAGVRASRITRGHRPLAPGPRAIARPAQYPALLRALKVIVDPAARRRSIEEQATRLAADVEGKVVLDPHLLEEIVMSVEHPYALRGSFDGAFLLLPREVLVTVMQHHQKYFAVEDARGRLLGAFIAVRDGGPAHAATVRQGHEWVLAARLADARFFFEEDRKHHLEDFVPALDGLVFQAQLGTVGDKTRRLAALAGTVASMLGLDGRTTESLARAAALCKADLVTRLVGEFPELQGTIGQIYASLDGAGTDVARAIGEHYRPTGAGDSPPRTELGAYLGLVDKTDTLAGAIGAGLTPTGSQDPYGLRRTGQGIIEIVLMLRLRLSMKTLAYAALAQFGRSDEQVADDVVEFLRQRLRGTLIERGVRYDVADAALAVSGDDLLAAAGRAEAVADAVGRAGFAPLYVAYDRASRILTADGMGSIDPALFEAPIERRLFEVVRSVEHPVAEAAGAGEYAAAMEHLRPLVGPVNQIFDDVLIMAPDERVRANRLALLRAVVAVFRHVADFAKIVMSEEEKQVNG
ncbi:MAG TPA: glycine--tRNA ligase subunit beta [bacterium]|nr:glycine--tRNA ligase subunit beta [bacterium]